MLTHNTKFSFETIRFPSTGLLDSFVQCTYVLTRKDSPHHKSMYKQLYQYRPTKTVRVYIGNTHASVHIPSEKSTKQNDSLTAYYNVFKDASEKKYHTILILEDACILNDRLRNPAIQNHIQNFMKQQSRSHHYCYSLGSIPFLISAFNFTHNTMKILGTGSHAIICPRQTILKCRKYIETLQHNDNIESIFNFTITRYNYKEPLCLRTIDSSNNSQQGWFVRLACKIFGLQNPDTVLKDFDNLYYIVKVIHLAIYFFLIFVGMYFIQKVIYWKKN